MYPSHPEPNNTWNEVLCKRGRPIHEDEEDQRERKHIKKSEHWLHPSPTSDRYTGLLEEGYYQQQ
jgi:hypothetical protein